MTPPFEVKDFFSMNKKEAEQHYIWYLSEVPERIMILKNFIALFDDSINEAMDYSPNSLIPLWAWYLKNVNILLKSEEEYQQEILQYPKDIRYSVSRYKLEFEWMAVAMDIGIYMALCFLEYDKKFKWGYVTKPKQDCVNKPSIMGFNYKMLFSPMDTMTTMIYKAADRRSKDTQLIEIFDYWINNY